MRTSTTPYYYEQPIFSYHSKPKDGWSHNIDSLLRRTKRNLIGSDYGIEGSNKNTCIHLHSPKHHSRTNDNMNLYPTAKLEQNSHLNGDEVVRVMPATLVFTVIINYILEIFSG